MNRDQILAAVLAIVSNRTGYPIDMLDPDLDLEADLSIDSIKRTEILGELGERVGLKGSGGASLDESMVEELARLKTLNAIADWVVAHLRPAPRSDTPGAAEGSPAPLCGGPIRQLVELEPLPSLPPARYETVVLAGRRYVIVDGGLGIGLELSELLEQARGRGHHPRRRPGWAGRRKPGGARRRPCPRPCRGRRPRSARDPARRLRRVA